MKRGRWLPLHSFSLQPDDYDEVIGYGFTCKSIVAIVTAFEHGPCYSLHCL